MTKTTKAKKRIKKREMACAQVVWSWHDGPVEGPNAQTLQSKRKLSLLTSDGVQISRAQSRFADELVRQYHYIKG